MTFLPEHIETRLREEIARRGMVLLELKRRGERGTTVVEVVIDSEDGVKLDDLTEVSRWTSELFDEAEDAIPGRYKLEVSSAGLDRPLEHLWQYRKNLGRLIKLTFDDDSGTRKTDVFRLIDLHDDVLTVTPKKKPSKGEEVHLLIPLARVTRATVEPQF
jgi:ribosome maturation factor RimP